MTKTQARLAEPGRRMPRLTAAVPGTPRMVRRRTGRIVGGVAGGIADHLGVRVLWVRAAFTVLMALPGAGFVIYALLWMLCPQEPIGAEERENSVKERQQAAALIAIGIGFVIATGASLGGKLNWLSIPLVVAVVGAMVVWREADGPDGHKRDARTAMTGVLTGGGGWRALVRVLVGAALVIGGISFALAKTNLGQVQFALVAAAATLVGVGVLTVPWWLRLVRDLGEERAARIRTEERAEIAAHLHDSVLQTLALIQKQPDVSREVLRLARGQERQLRDWLYSPSGYGTRGKGDEGPATLSAAIARASGEVEDTFAIAVRPVFVGDCPMDHDLAALAKAAREAMVNAAKHSGESEISVYAEVEPEKVTVFVRDRGKGFDPDTVSTDRHGLADSVRGRMERHGGEAILRTAVGEGTEVRLTMPRAMASAAKEKS